MKYLYIQTYNSHRAMTHAISHRHLNSEKWVGIRVASLEFLVYEGVI
jgi:hypothetical protein